MVKKLAARSDVLIENFKVGGLEEVRPRLREPREGMPAADLLLGHRLRPDRALCVARRLRPDGAGHGRLHEPHRHGRRRADARRRADRRHHHRRLCGGRHPRRAARARARPAAARWSTPRWSTRRSACSPTRRSTISSPARCPSASATRIPTSCPTRCSRSPTATSSSPPATTASIVKLCGVLGEPALAEKPDYKDNNGRLAHRDELVARLSALTEAHDQRRPAGQARSGRRAGRPDQRCSIRCSPIRR